MSNVLSVFKTIPHILNETAMLYKMRSKNLRGRDFSCDAFKDTYVKEFFERSFVCGTVLATDDQRFSLTTLAIKIMLI